MSTEGERAARWALAFAEQTVTVHYNATRRGIRDYGSRQSQVFMVFLRRIAERGARKELGLCPHLDYRSPSPSYWLAWHPEMLRCASCVRQVVEPEVKGQGNQDLICDRCGFVSPTLDDQWSGYGQLQAATPLPVVVICGLCERCAKEDGL